MNAQQKRHSFSAGLCTTPISNPPHSAGNSTFSLFWDMGRLHPHSCGPIFPLAEFGCLSVCRVSGSDTQNDWQSSLHTPWQGDDHSLRTDTDSFTGLSRHRGHAPTWDEDLDFSGGFASSVVRLTRTWGAEKRERVAFNAPPLPTTPVSGGWTLLTQHKVGAGNPQSALGDHKSRPASL